MEVGAHLVVERLGVELRRRPGGLLAVAFAEDLVLRPDDLLNLQMRPEDALEEHLFRELVGAGFDHHHRVLGAHDHQVEVRDVALAVGRVDDDLLLDHADPHRSHRMVEGDVGEHQRRRGTVDRQDVRIVLAVGGQAEGDDLGVGGVAFGEKRAEGTVDLAGGDDLFFGGAAFPLEKAAGDLAGRRRVLPVVDRQRKEIALDAGLDFHAGGGEHHRVAVAHGAGAVRLLGQMAGFEDERAFPDGNLFTLPHDVFLSFCPCLFCLRLGAAGTSRRPRDHAAPQGLRGAGGPGPLHEERAQERRPPGRTGTVSCRRAESGATCGARGARWCCGSAPGPGP